MLFMTSFLIHNSWIKLIGAAYLIHLAFDNLGDMTGGGSEEEDDLQPIKMQSFWATVLTVETMDLIFSIDNVVAAVSLSDKIWVVMIGVAIGILTMRFAAGIFSYAVRVNRSSSRLPMCWCSASALSLILEQVWQIEISDILRFRFLWGLS